MGRIKSIIKIHIIGVSFSTIFLLLSQSVHAQKKETPNGSGVDGRPHTSKDLRKAQWKKQRKIDKATQKALKLHMKHQTKEVRKRMRKNAKKAAENNSR